MLISDNKACAVFGRGLVRVLMFEVFDRLVYSSIVENDILKIARAHW